METSKVIKKSIIYFLPVVVINIVFALIDKNLQNNSLVDNEISSIRLRTILLGLYFNFFVIPIYLVLLNIIFNIKDDISHYYSDIKLTFLSILGGNLCVLVLNSINIYFFKTEDISCILEFLMILIPQSIMLGILSFFGSFLVMKKDTEEEEALEGLKIENKDITLVNNENLAKVYENNGEKTIKDIEIHIENGNLDSSLKSLQNEDENNII